MGSGKKNYKSLRSKSRQWQKTTKNNEEKNRVIKQENIDELKKMWMEKKKENGNKS